MLPVKTVVSGGVRKGLESSMEFANISVLEHEVELRIILSFLVCASRKVGLPLTEIGKAMRGMHLRG